MWIKYNFSLNNLLVFINRSVLVWGKVEWRNIGIFYGFLLSAIYLTRWGIWLLVWQAAHKGEAWERFPKCDNSEIYMILQKISHKTEKEFYKLSIITNRFQPTMRESAYFLFSLWKMILQHSFCMKRPSNSMQSKM